MTTPYVNIFHNLSRVKTKLMFNLTKYQLICFRDGLVGALPICWPVGPVGGTGAIALMAMYEKDSLS